MLKNGDTDKEINYIHPINSYEISNNINFLDSIEIFKKHKYFILYDSLTLYQSIAILCGCIIIIYPLPNISKIDWFKQSYLWSYLESNNLTEIYGIAYGLEDLSYVETKLDLVYNQWLDIIKYYKNIYIKNFINDLGNFNNLLNLVENNFIFN